MDTDTRNTQERASFAGDEEPLAAEFVPLVQIMLGVIGRCHDALLQDEAETLHVIRSTLRHVCGSEHQEELAHWFHGLSSVLKETHPRAVEILRLRFSGLDSRGIAARLNLPFRLVQHVLADLASRGVRFEVCREEGT